MCKFLVWVGTSNLCRGKRRLAFSDDWEKVLLATSRFALSHLFPPLEKASGNFRHAHAILHVLLTTSCRSQLVSSVFSRFFSPTYGAAFISGSWRRRVFHASSCCGEMSSSVLDLEATERERTRGAARPSCPRGDTNRAAGLSGKWSGKGATCVRTVPRTCPIFE